jgi:hypothetical protein
MVFVATGGGAPNGGVSQMNQAKLSGTGTLQKKSG